MECNNYEFCVGDEVETVDGMVGKIVSICHCERCAERGFFEPKWETSDGEYSDYITVNQANWGFPYYRRIGKYVWNHDADEEKSTKNIFTKENKKMKEIKLTIDGKEIQLTDEQLKMLGIEPEKKRKNPFERVAENEYYYCIKSIVGIDRFQDRRDNFDNTAYRGSNYFNDEQLANQVALRQLLYRKLLKYAYSNGFEDTSEWDGENKHWSICYNYENRTLATLSSCLYKSNVVWFSSEKGAEQAIAEIVEPFMKEHPEFVW